MEDNRESQFRDAEQKANQLGAYAENGQKEPEQLKTEIREQHKIMRGVIQQKSAENRKKLNWVQSARSPQERSARAREVGIS